MATFRIASYSPEYFEGVKTLWQEAFPDDPPWNKAEVAVPAKFAVQPELFLVALDGVAIEACRHQVLLRIITSALGSRLEMVNDEIAPSLKRIANVSTVDAPEAIPSKNPRVSIYFSYRRHLCIPLRQILRPD